MSCAKLPLASAQAKDSDCHGLPRGKNSQLRQELQIPTGPWFPWLILSGTFVFVWLLISCPTGLSFVLAYFLRECGRGGKGGRCLKVCEV